MLSRTTILEALNLLSAELAADGVLGELCLVGGTAMVLAFDARTATKDVDAIFEPTAEMRAAAAKVASKMDLPADWLNDAAKGFLSPLGEFVELASLDLSNLRIQAPTAAYMLAMKVLAARTGVAGERGDSQDIAFLIQLLDLKSTEAVMDIVSKYYDPSRVLPRFALFGG